MNENRHIEKMDQEIADLQHELEITEGERDLLKEKMDRIVKRFMELLEEDTPCP